MLNNINVKNLRGGSEMHKYKFVFFLTSLFFICTILVSAPVSAQGNFFDALCGAIANNVNELVIGQEVDHETKQIQTSAVKVLLRGNESDWDEFVDSTKDWAESSLKTESSKTTQPTTYRKEQQKFVKEVSRIKKDIGKTYYFEGKIGNINFTMEVPPYKYGTYDNKTNRRGTAIADREAKILGIYPLNHTARLGNKIKTFFNNLLSGTEKNKQYLVILDVYYAKEEGNMPRNMCMMDAGWAFSEYAMIIDEQTKYLDIFKDVTRLRGWGGWYYNSPDSAMKWNIPNVFIYDLNHDGFDEITLLRSSQGGGGGPYYDLIVYSTKQLPMKKMIELNVLLVGSGDDIINYRNIHFDGDNLYVDGKNIMSYQ